MTRTPWMLALVLLALVAPRASADDAKQQGKRETKFERTEIDDAIADAQEAAATAQDAVRDALAASGKDGHRRQDQVNGAMADLVKSLDRLRQRFDDDAPWQDQRAEVRTAFTQWRELDPLIRHHWASDSRDEFEKLHVELRRLGRIYEVDAPART